MLFNTRQFNTGMLNGGTTIATVYSTDRLVFENFSLSDGSSMIMTDLRVSGATREIVGGPIPRSDGAYVTADYFRDYTVEASGIVQQDTAALLDAQLDTIRKNLRQREGNLDVIDSNSTVKRFVVTVDNYDEMFADRERYHITICPWKVRFRCKTPFGKARSYTTTSLDFTSSPTSQSFVNSGTYKAPAVFILIFASASSVTSIAISNALTGESITYTGTASAGDVFQFDSEAKQVLKNGTAADFSGSFPFFDLGANNVSFTINGTFSVSMTGKFKLTYL